MGPVILFSPRLASNSPSQLPEQLGKTEVHYRAKVMIEMVSQTVCLAGLKE
jgi:hypothetical protein